MHRHSHCVHRYIYTHVHKCMYGLATPELALGGLGAVGQRGDPLFVGISLRHKACVDKCLLGSTCY